MATTTRIYLVNTQEGKQRLVEAATRSQAVNHVANTTIKATVATQSDLVRMTKEGIDVEVAGREEE